MSSSGGGIVVHPVGHPNGDQPLKKSEGQTIADCLTAAGYTALAAKIRAAVDAAEGP